MLFCSRSISRYPASSRERLTMFIKTRFGSILSAVLLVAPLALALTVIMVQRTSAKETRLVYDKKVDEMRNRTTRKAHVDSESTLNFAFPYNDPNNVASL